MKPRHLSTLIALAGLLFLSCGGEQKQSAAEQYRQQLIEKNQSRIDLLERDLITTDSLLQAAIAHYDRLQNRLHSGQKLEPDFEQQLTAARLKRDSLQVKWDTQGAQIRFLRKKMEHF